MKPPPSETDSERARVSEQIDEDLREERERLKKSKTDVKLLLLGQAESGKSTLQKQFQLMYKPNSLDQERLSWRTVIYFNVVHSLKHILNTLEAWDDDADDGDDTPGPEDANGTRIADQPSPSTSLMDPGDMHGTPSSTDHSMASGSRSTPSSSGAIQIANLRRRLSPLIATDAQLADRLSGGLSVSGSGKGGVYVRSGWQARTIENGIGKVKQKRPNTSDKKARESASTEIPPDPMVEEIGRLLQACEEDIHALWGHPILLCHFLPKHISRVASPDYVPTTDDILHARIQTMGVAEHIFDVNIHGKSVTWHLYDVGGARGQRHSWVPYFDDANAIIFVAPVSAFDQYLEEDPRTNRIDDSLQLFTQICSNALLKSVHLVLFLNKTDLLRSKLDRGLKVRKYITSFGERSNDYETVVQYFRAHFLQVHRRNNENRRVLYTHFTSVVDTKATQRLLETVMRDSIFRGYLQSAALV
ncbi:guanine nucleotide-binding protein [Flammula alnicola]|nr:guanine nucleotide-binding protein [Flammula alnicola]